MIWYISVATFLFIGYFYKRDKMWYRLSLILLFLFTGLRHFTLGGSDAKIYSEYYDVVPPLTQFGGFNGRYEIGYTLFNAFLKIFSGSYAFFQIGNAALSIILINLIVNKLDFNDSEKCLFLFIYFCYRYIWNTFVILRQNIANLIIWILIFSVFTSKKKKWFVYIFSLIISALFHSTSIFNLVLFPLMLLIKKANPQMTLIIATLLSVVLYVFSASYVGNIIEMVARVAGDRFADYSSEENINIINLLLRLTVMWLIGLNLQRINHKHKNTIFVAVVFSVVLGSINLGLVIRFYEYYAVGVYAGIPLLVNLFRKKDRWIITLFVYILMMIIFIRFLFSFHGGWYGLFF